MSSRLLTLTLLAITCAARAETTTLGTGPLPPFSCEGEPDLTSDVFAWPSSDLVNTYGLSLDSKVHDFAGRTVKICAMKGDLFHFTGRSTLETSWNWDGRIDYEICTRRLYGDGKVGPLVRVKLEGYDKGWFSDVVLRRTSRTLSYAEYWRAPTNGRFEVGLCASWVGLDMSQPHPPEALGGVVYVTVSTMSALRLAQ